MNTSTSEPAAARPAGNRATAALVLGILSIICCPLGGPVAWYLGAQEGNAIRAGHSPAAGEGLAKAGMILGILGTILFVFCALWVMFWGGMAVLSGFWQS